MDRLPASPAADVDARDPLALGAAHERALDPAERHRRGAHFTTRALVERLVRPTVLDPLRADWERARAEALAAGDPDAALARVDRFRDDLARVRVLDPACGAGNLLVVAYELLADLDDETLLARAALAPSAPPADRAVGPGHLLGIEQDPRAAALADEATRLAHAQRLRRLGLPPDPSAGPALEVRDALVTADGGEADWPDADYIVGNPPFLGSKRLRATLGDAYVDALRAAWPAMPGDVDLALYWWDKAARQVRAGRARRFGLITTSSVTQVSHRAVVRRHLDAGLALLYAVPDHPWIVDGASVRIALTVAGLPGPAPRLGSLAAPRSGDVADRPVARIHADLRAGADLAALRPLRANQGLCFMGITPVGRGFSLTAADLDRLDLDPAALPSVVRPTLNARELTQGGAARWVIDFFGLSEVEAADAHPRLFAHVLERVRPEREANARAAYRVAWWIFGEPRPAFRRAVAGLRRYVATPITSRHRCFVWLGADVLPDCQLHAIAVDDPVALGVLGSRVHRVFALAAGSRMGLGNDPRWRSGPCFDPFPFPDLVDGADRADLSARIGLLAEALDAHRADARAAGIPLGALARRASSELRALHEALDAAVAEAYRWPADLPDDDVLERLAALNAERAAEEAHGLARRLGSRQRP